MTFVENLHWLPGSQLTAFSFRRTVFCSVLLDCAMTILPFNPAEDGRRATGCDLVT
jgi:hypothetical protein